jgi:NADPH-dependent 2,4-dienoyl-CoA reductase/sulfur reductase-like enzyme
MTHGRLLVVGASVAGTRLVRAARDRGWEGEIVLADAEAHYPYDKPGLTKEYLLSTDDVSLTLETAESLQALQVDYLPGMRARSLDLDKRSVSFDSGEVCFDQLVIATGCRARTLPFQHGVDGVHTVRTIHDAERLHGDLESAKRLVVIGGGFIGAEIACAARHRGIEVEILERSSALLHRMLPSAVGDAVAALHVDNGVAIRYNTTTTGFETCEGRVTGVHLSDGSTIPADLVVVGIGAEPETSWLDGSGVLTEDGVLCDPFLRASQLGVWAIGDVARWHNERYDRTMRVEHWTSAREQAATVAQNLVAEPDALKRYSCVPYVWSDQFGARIQHVGFAGSQVVEEPSDRGRIFLHLNNAELVGATTVNDPRSMIGFRRTLAAPPAARV